MAALPNTNISVTAVKQALGVSSNDIGSLFLHPNVNPFGWNLESSAIQAALWGKSVEARTKLSPNAVGYVPILGVPAGYALGHFRRYDPDWQAYQFGILSMEEGSSFTTPVQLNLGVEKALFIEKPAPATHIYHTFKIEFSRFSNFSNSVVINENFEARYPSSPFEVDMRYPPDYATNGALVPGNKFYIKYTHLSSPVRRWFEFGPEFVITEFTVPQNAYSELATIKNVYAASAKVTSTSTLYIYVNSDVYADFSTSTLLTVSCQVSTTSDFSSNVVTLSKNVSSGINPTPGTQSFVDTANFDFSSSFSYNQTSIGQTLYYRILINGNVVYNQSMTVLSQLPIEP